MQGEQGQSDVRPDRLASDGELLSRAAAATGRILEQARADFAELQLAGPSQEQAAAIHADVAAAARALSAELECGARKEPV